MHGGFLEQLQKAPIIFYIVTEVLGNPDESSWGHHSVTSSMVLTASIFDVIQKQNKINFDNKSSIFKQQHFTMGSHLFWRNIHIFVKFIFVNFLRKFLKKIFKNIKKNSGLLPIYILQIWACSSIWNLRSDQSSQTPMNLHAPSNAC